MMQTFQIAVSFFLPFACSQLPRNYSDTSNYYNQQTYGQSNYPTQTNYTNPNYYSLNNNQLPGSANVPQQSSNYPYSNYPQTDYGQQTGGYDQNNFISFQDGFNDQNLNFYDNRENDVNYGRYGGYDDLYTRQRCPIEWVRYRESCYRFIKSPARPRHEARKICQAYDSDLVSIDTVEEHGFLINQLLRQDPQHRRWYTSVRQQSPQFWANDGDGTQLTNMENAFLPQQQQYQIYDPLLRKDFLVYKFSDQLRKWGFEMVDGEESLLFICEATISKLHFLIGDDRTYTYGINIDDPEKIPRGPYFLKQPNETIFDLTRELVNYVTLSCLAGGYPTPTYEWFEEDYVRDKLISKKIDPLSDNRYTISGGSLIINDPDNFRDRKKYHCKVTNRFGSIISESVPLSFGFISEFTMIRSPESGNENWGKVILCDPPQHYPSLNYYWARNYFPNLVDEDKRVFVSNDGGLYFSALEKIDRGNYSCNVENVAISTGKSGPFFTLFVNPHSNYQQLKFPNNFPKAFPEAPVVGEPLRLECMAFGYPIPSYNWTRRGGEIPKHAVYTSYSRVLTINPISVEDEGEYVCTISNNRAAMNSSVVVSVQAKPNFTIPLIDKHIDNKADFTWTCEAFGIPDVNYTWWKNGDQLTMETLAEEDRNRYFIQDNILTIKYADPERDPGMYQCQATNQLKSVFSSAQLRVLSLRPSFKKFPLESETYAANGGNVTIVCNPEAAPRPKFIWKKDNQMIGAGGTRRILENGNLIITRVSRDDAGLYTCQANNQYGSDESQGRLIVVQPPTFIERLAPRIQTRVGQNLFLHCNAYSDELLDTAIIWFHNGMRLREFDIEESSIYEDKRIIVDSGDLSVFNISLADTGEYECMVISAVGKISSRTYLLVEGPPGPPGGLQVLNVKKNSVQVQWTDGANNGNPILGYIVSGKTNWNSTWVNISTNVFGREYDRYSGRKEGIIETILTPWSMYEFRIQAYNLLGYGVPSSPSPQFSTPPDKPYRAPYNIGGGGGKIGDLTMTWDTLPQAEQNAPGTHYKIFWRRYKHDLEFQSLKLEKYGNVGSAVVHVSSEFFYTQYEIKVQAFNEIGAGPISDPVIIYSAEDMPQVAPQQVSSVSYNSTALNVTWQPIDQTRERIRGKLIGHRLKYWKENNIEETSVYYLSRSTRNWALIVGLQPDTYYFVKVMAFNSAGEGPESERFLERTFRKAPQKPPSAVHVYSLNPNSIRVVWRYVAPTQEEEPLNGYKVRVWEIDQDMSLANDTIVPVGVKLEANIDNLTPGKRYNLRVLGFSNGGDGRMSSPTIIFQMGEYQPASYYRFSSSNSNFVKPNVIVSSILLGLLYVFH